MSLGKRECDHIKHQSRPFNRDQLRVYSYCVDSEKLTALRLVTIDTSSHHAENMALVLYFSKGTYAPASTFPHCRLLAASCPDGMWRLIQR